MFDRLVDSQLMCSSENTGEDDQAILDANRGNATLINQVQCAALGPSFVL